MEETTPHRIAPPPPGRARRRPPEPPAAPPELCGNIDAYRDFLRAGAANRRFAAGFQQATGRPMPENEVEWKALASEVGVPFEIAQAMSDHQLAYEILGACNRLRQQQQRPPLTKVGVLIYNLLLSTPPWEPVDMHAIREHIAHHDEWRHPDSLKATMTELREHYGVIYAAGRGYHIPDSDRPIGAISRTKILWSTPPATPPGGPTR